MCFCDCDAQKVADEMIVVDENRIALVRRLTKVLDGRKRDDVLAALAMVLADMYDGETMEQFMSAIKEMSVAVIEWNGWVAHPKSKVETATRRRIQLLLAMARDNNMMRAEAAAFRAKVRELEGKVMEQLRASQYRLQTPAAYPDQV
jgi:hypothetical protein